MTLSDVLKQSLRSIGEYIIGFVVFLAAFLAVLDYLGFKISLATFYNNLDPNGKITFILALTIILCSIFFTITIYVINRLVKEIDENKRIIIKSKP
jgi:preprotein translocase subunit SecE